MGKGKLSVIRGRRQTQEAVCALDEVSKIDKFIQKADHQRLWETME